MEPDEKSIMLIAVNRREPLECFVCNQCARVAFELSERLAIANEVLRILMRRLCVVLCRKPLIETMIIGLRLERRIEHTVTMELADETRLVAPGFQ